jgi:hypothetical protein
MGGLKNPVTLMLQLFCRCVQWEALSFQHGEIGSQRAVSTSAQCIWGISKMRKSLWMLPMALLITALGSTSALADTVVTNGGGYVTAIDGITINGSLYNVTFTSTIDNTFSAFAYNSPTITATIHAIDSDLGSALLNDANGADYGIATLGFTTVFANDAPPWTEGLTPMFTFVWDSLATSTPGYVFWANFNPAVVATPEPATEPLTLAGLGVIAVLMWKRRQDALRQPQAP